MPFAEQLRAFQELIDEGKVTFAILAYTPIYLIIYFWRGWGGSQIHGAMNFNSHHFQNFCL